MAKFCGKCGAKLDEATGFCPNCNADQLNKQIEKPEWVETPKPKQNTTPPLARPISKKEAKKKRKAYKKAEKKAEKNEKRAAMTKGQKARRFFLKLLLLLILLVIAGGIIGGLSYMGIFDIPFLSDYNKDNILKTLNERSIVVEETDIVMESDDSGTANIVVQIPDYGLLFKEAYASKNPDLYLVKALALGQYEVREYEEVAAVTVKDGETTIHSEEVVHQILEEALINAINDSSEVE